MLGGRLDASPRIYSILRRLVLYATCRSGLVVKSPLLSKALICTVITGDLLCDLYFR